MSGAPRGGAALYTPDLLALAVSLGPVPFDSGMPLSGEARSRTCGSTLAMSLACDAGARIERIGVRANACAVGQAAAALFVQGANGCDVQAIDDARGAIAAWLAGDGPLPGWPGFDALEPARAYPVRHGAVLLAWDAALAALSNAGSAR